MKNLFLVILFCCLLAVVASQAAFARALDVNESGAAEYFSNTDALVYPNPFNDRLTVTVRSAPSPVSEIKIYNLIGREIISVQVSAMIPFTQEIDLSELEPGIYFCNIYSESSILQTKKIIKSK